MDIYAGTDGNAAASGFNLDIDQWQAAVGAEDTIAWRTFANAWKSKKNTGYGGSGSFRGTVQRDISSSAPMPSLTGGSVDRTSFEGVSLTLTAAAGCTLTGTANMTIVNLTRDANDRMIGVVNFEFDGAVSIAWDETP